MKNLILLHRLLCFMLLLLLISCSPKISLEKSEHVQYRMDSGTQEVDSVIIREIEPYKKVIDSELSSVIGVSEQKMEKAQPEGLLGNFVADLCLKKAKERKSSARIDFCFLNNGGLRTGLPKGDITKKKIFELMPFENELVLITFNGGIARQLFDFMANKGGMPVSGAAYVIGKKNAEGIVIGGAAFDSTREYTAVTSDYLAGGGDDLGFLAGAKEKVYLDLKVRDAIIEYITDENKKSHTIKVSLDGRVSKLP